MQNKGWKKAVGDWAKSVGAGHNKKILEVFYL